MSSKPAIVLVHGSWHSPKNFEFLTKHLQEAGYEVIAPPLPSVWGEDISKIHSLNPDIDAVRNAILPALNSNNVFVLSHSYGTIPASASLKDLDTQTRSSQGYKTSVLGFAIISGVLLPEDVALLDYFGGKPAIVHDLDEPANLVQVADPPGPSYFFYNDCLPEVAIEASKSLAPQAWAVNITKLPFAGHYHVPTTYLICERDNGLPAFWQRMIIDRARKDVSERGKGDDWIKAGTIESSHSPFLSMPEKTGLWLRKVMGEDVEIDGIGVY